MENKEKDRMKELVRLFEKKDEIFADDKKVVNEDALKKEYNRLKSLGSGNLNANFKENYGVSNDWGLGGRGMTVNSMINSVYDNSPVTFNAIKQPLKTEEALDIAIKRTIESGAPVNNMDFYTEVNWQLTQLGFPSRTPLDIKNKLVSMIVKDKE